ncbi:MAG TPA: DNA replication/repair protein RecF [Candidatus Saccharimonadales bacterium]|nr:DNA replication/repair protein RecF [Candidatus Saccharimonadales bacterium]
MLTDLRLQHFRSYKDASFEFGAGVNIIVGPNASGKTNLLEAILVLARGTSYRVRDTDLVQFKQDWARLDSHLDDGSQRSLKLVLAPEPSKTYEIAGKPFKRLTLAHSLPTVLFEPNHLQLLSGSPERRRDYLDDLIEQTTPGYGAVRRQYRRTLAQRNALLKSRPQDLQKQLFAWDVRLSQLGGQIVRARHELTKRINNEMPLLYRELAHISGKQPGVMAEYAATWPPENYESQLLKKLATSIELDQDRGFTGSGPHREDLLVSIGGHPASAAASRGETRTLVLALKIIELKLLAEARDTTPLLLLDDVFSELDGSRRRALTEHLAPYQTFITTTDADIITHHFTDSCTVLALK